MSDVIHILMSMRLLRAFTFVASLLPVVATADCHQRVTGDSRAVEFACTYGIEFKIVESRYSEPAVIKIRLEGGFETKEFLAKSVENEQVVNLIGYSRIRSSSSGQIIQTPAISLYGFKSSAGLRWLAVIADDPSLGDRSPSTLVYNLDGVVGKSSFEGQFNFDRLSLPKGARIIEASIQVDSDRLVYEKLGF